MQHRFAVAVAFALATSSVLAAPITPTFDTFGPQPTYTFGGSGIPNDAVANTVISGSVGGVPFTSTVALTATGRFANPSTTNNGAGVFQATLGPDSPPNLARWNFDFRAENSAAAVANVSFRLRYDFDPGIGTDESQLGTVFLGATALVQDSWNLGFNFLNIDSGFVITPAYPSFDPNAPGEYSFALIATNVAEVELGRVAILVNVPGASVPEPASFALLGLGLLGIGLTRRRKR